MKIQLHILFVVHVVLIFGENTSAAENAAEELAASSSPASATEYQPKSTTTRDATHYYFASESMRTSAKLNSPTELSLTVSASHILTGTGTPEPTTSIANSSDIPNPRTMSSWLDDQFFAISICLLPVFLFFGLIGNAFSIHVLVMERLMLMKYLLALSVSDTLFLITGLLYWITEVVGLTDPALQNDMQAVMFPQISVYINVVAGSLSSQYTFLLTVERFVAVFAPFKTMSSPLSRRAGVVVVSSGLFTCLFLIPQLLKYKTVYTLDQTSGMMRYMVVQTELLKKNKVFLQGVSMSYAMIYSVLFPVLVFALSISIVYVLRKAMQAKSKLTQLTDAAIRPSREATRIVLAIATTYLICYVPASIAHIVNLAHPDYGNGRNPHYNAFLEIRFFLVVINSSLNFCFYMTLNERFRKRVKLCFRCGSKADSPTLVSDIQKSFQMNTIS